MDESELLDRGRTCDGGVANPHRMDFESAFLISRSKSTIVVGAQSFVIIGWPLVTQNGGRRGSRLFEAADPSL